jgi:hypothetical protein
MCSYLSLVLNSQTAQFQPIGKKRETARGDGLIHRQFLERPFLEQPSLERQSLEATFPRMDHP